MESNRMDGTRVEERLQLLSCGQIPNAYFVVGSSRCQTRAVGTKGQSGDFGWMLQSTHFLAVSDVPHPHRLAGSRSNLGAGTIESHCPNGLRRRAERLQNLTFGHVPQ